MKKRILAMLVTLSMVLTMVPTIALAADSPTEIDSAEDLVDIANNMSDDYILTDDITLSGEWTPIATEYSNGFSGTLDGNGHTISGLTIIQSNDNNCYGLFETIYGGTVKNLTFDDVNISYSGDECAYVGALAGYGSGSNVVIDNVTVNGAVSGTGYVGGLIGYNYSSGNASTFTALTNNATVNNTGAYAEGTSYVGGIMGYQSDYSATANYWVNTGSVTYGATLTGSWEPENTYIGGLAGASISAVGNIYNTGDVTLNVTYESGTSFNLSYFKLGGLVGYTSNALYNSYNQGDVTVTCENTTGFTTTAEPAVGGLVSNLPSSSSACVYNCYNTGTLSNVFNSTQIGAVASYVKNTAASVANVYWNDATMYPAYSSDSYTSCMSNYTNCGTFDTNEYTGDLTLYGSNGTLAAETLVDALNAWSMEGYTTATWKSEGGALPTFVAPATISGTLKGYTTTGDTVALEGATVTMGSTTATTDENGEFIFEKVYAATYTVEVEYDGYLTTSFLYEVGSEDVTDLAINMIEIADSLGTGDTISSINELAYFAEEVAESSWNSVTLAEDLDLDGFYWTPIASGEADFDGGGKTIKNLTVSTASDSAGLFGVLYGDVCDLTLENVDIATSYYAGALAGATNNATVSNVTVLSGSVYSSGAAAGGLVGSVGSGTIENCSNGTNDTNGVSVTGTYSYGNDVGGVVGYVATYASISNLTNYGDVTGVGSTGGVVGDLQNSSESSKLVNYGNVIDGANVGGVVGSAGSNSALSQSYNYGTVTGTLDGNVGGLVGDADGDINNSANFGDVYGDDNTGGLVGYADGTILNSYNEGTIIATADQAMVGGLVGYMNTSNLYNSYNAGTVTVQADGTYGSDTYLGGIIGYMYSTSSVVNNVYSVGTMTVETGPTIGTAMGYAKGTITAYVLENSSFSTYGDKYSDEPNITTFDSSGTINETTLLVTLNAYVSADTTGNYQAWVIDGESEYDYPTFEAPVAVTGTIYDDYDDGEESTALENVTVNFYSYGDSLGSATASATTDGDGKYTVELLSGNYWMEIVGSDEYSQGFHKVTISSGTGVQDAYLIKLIAMTPTNENLYEIDSIGELAWLAVKSESNSFSNMTLQLTADLDFTNHDWTPIGNSSYRFKGIFDGDDNTITGLNVQGVDTYLGFFGYLGTDSVVQDLTLSNVNVIGTGDYVGALAGGADYTNTIENITVTDATVEGDASYTGGVLGQVQDSTILDNIAFSGDVLGSGDVGGIVAYIYTDVEDAEVNNLTVNGTVSSSITDDDGSAGGIAEFIRGAFSGENWVNNANVTAYSASGIASSIEVDGNLTNLTNTGTVSGFHAAAGIALDATGDASCVSLYHLVNTGAVSVTGTSSSSCAAGLVYSLSSTSYIYNSYNWGDVTVTNGDAYGIANSAYDATNTIFNSYSTGTVTGKYAYATTDLDGTENSNYYLTEAVGSNSYNYGTAITDNTALLTALNKWVTDNSGSHTDVTLATWQLTDDGTTTYPIYNIPATISFDANGGTGSVSDVDTFVGSTFTDSTLPTPGFTHTDANFVGWTTTEDEYSTLITDETAYTVPSTENTLYAYWAKGLDSATIAYTGDTTFRGSPLTTSFTVKDGNDDLTADTHYTVSITVKGGDGIEVAELVNAGTYTATFTGVEENGYTGTNSMDFTIEPMTVKVSDSTYKITKTYDGDGFDSGDWETTIATDVENVTATVSSLDTGNYTAKDAQTYDVTLILAETLSVTGDLVASNYALDNDEYEMEATIEQYVVYDIADSSTATGSASKTYDGTTTVGTGSTISATLYLVGADDAETPDSITIGFSSSAFGGVNVGTQDIVLTLNATSLSSSNYTLYDSFPETYTLAGKGTINVASYALPAMTQTAKQGSGVDVLTTTFTANGVTVDGATEAVTGTVAFYSDEGCTTELADSDMNTLAVGNHTFYYTFAPDASNTNYVITSLKASFTLTITEGDPQNISFADGTSVSKTYGDDPFTNAVTVKTTDDAVVENGGTVTYQSSNAGVATVDANGEVTIVGTGTTTIKATAAVATGYATGEESYELTVVKKELTITIGDLDMVYGTDVDDVDYDYTISADTTLVGDDSKMDITFDPSCAVIATSNAGTTHDITADFSADNYTFVVTKGVLTVTKAEAPTVSDVETSFYYNSAHANETVSVMSELPTDCGDVDFTVGIIASNSIISGDVTTTATGIQFSTKIGDVNDTVTIPVTVSTTNYKDVNVNVVITLVDKTTVTISGVTVDNKTYNNTSISYDNTNLAFTEGYDGTVDYIWSSGSAPIDVGSYTLTVKIPDSNEDYMGSLVIDFTISKATQSPLTITSATTVVHGNTLDLTTSGGSGTGNVTYAITNGTGTATSTDGVLTPTGAGTVTVTATKAADTNYTEVSSSAVTIIIQKSDTTTAAAYLDKAVYTYGDLVTVTFTPEATGTNSMLRTVEMQYAALYLGDIQLASGLAYAGAENTLIWDTSDGTVSADSFNSETATFTLYWGGDDNLNENSQTLTATLGKKSIEIDTASATDREYDAGSAYADADVTFVDEDGTAVTFIKDTDYTVSAQMDDENVGVGKTAIVTVTLINEYYSLETATKDTTVTISATDYDGTTTADISTKYGNEATYDLFAWGDLTGAQFGNIVTSGDSIFDGEVTIEGNTLSYTIVGDDTLVGREFVITIPVTCTNYNTFDIVITVTVTDKEVPDVSADASYSKPYDGTAVTAADFNPESGEVDGIWSIKGDTEITDVADTGYLALVFTPSDTETYSSVEVVVTATITQKTVTVTADNKTMVIDESLPTFTVSYDGIINGDESYVAGAEASVTTDGTAVGGYDITVTTLPSDSSGNYTFEYETGTLSVTLSEAEQSVVDAIDDVEGDSLDAVAQASYNTQEALETYIQAMVEDLVDNDDVDISISTISFTAAIKGTSSNTTGTDGSYSFTVTATYGEYSETSDPITVDIDATDYVNSSSFSSSSNASNSEPNVEVSANDDGSATAVPETNTSIAFGIATASVSDEAMDAALDSALDASKSGDISIEIPVDIASSGTGVAVELSSDALDFLADSGANLVVNSDLGNVTIPSDASSIIADQANGEDVTIALNQVDSTADLTEAQQDIVGDAPVYDLAISAGDESITDLGGASVEMTLPYELDEDMNSDGVEIWAVDKDGAITKLEATYDEEAQTVTFEMDALTTVAIVYTEAAEEEFIFTDVDVNAYYYDAVKWAVANSITSGTTETTFSPDATCTRAQAVMFLYRAAGEPEVSGDMIFADVSVDAYYYDAVLWAGENGITKGTTETTFSPDANCTRSQIATFLWNCAGNPVVDYAMSFTDVASDTWYAEAVRWAVSEGITSGTTTTTFAPASDCTRGQIVTFLYRYLAE